MMQNIYAEIKEKKENERDKKYSRRAIYMGVIGFAVATVNSYFTGEPSYGTFTAPINELTNTQLIDTVIFSMSSLSYFTGGLMYGLIDFFEENSKQDEKKREKNGLEKELKD